MTRRRQILVIKHGALGDIIQGLDGFASLRHGHKDDHLAVMTSPAFAGLMRLMPFFDEVIVDPRAKPWNLPEILRMRGVFRRGWDRIYDFQSSRRTSRYFNHFVPKDVEFVGNPEGATFPLPDMTGLNNRDRMVQTAMIGGCPEVVAETGWLTATGIAAAAPRKTAVLIPGCSPAKPAKRWPGEGYAGLAQLLAQAGYTPVLVGTSLDRAAGDAILAHFPECEDQIGKTSLVELAQMLATADIAIGNDTGPVFLAARLGAPTLMLMSRHTDPAMSAPTGPAAAWLREDDIAAITPEAAFAAVQQLSR